MPQMKGLKELSCWSATKTEAGRYDFRVVVGDGDVPISSAFFVRHEAGKLEIVKLKFIICAVFPSSCLLCSQRLTAGQDEQSLLSRHSRHSYGDQQAFRIFIQWHLANAATSGAALLPGRTGTDEMPFGKYEVIIEVSDMVNLVGILRCLFFSSMNITGASRS
jgi:hypothetical protein